MDTWRIGLLATARRWWAVVALATGVGALLAYQYGSSASPTYEAEARLLVTAPGTELGALQTGPQLAPTYAELVRSTPVLQGAVTALKGRVTSQELRENVRGEWNQESRLLTVRARSSDPAVAVQAANELAKALDRVASTEPPASGSEESTLRTELTIVDPATDADRVRPQSLLLMEFGALAGFFFAVALAVLVDSRRGFVRDEEDLTQLTECTVLGSVNGGPLSRPVGPGPSDGAAREGADSYRRLVERLAAVGGEEVPRRLLVFGAQRDSGSGTVAANLATALAESGMRVVLADLAEKVEAARVLAPDGRGAGSAGVKRHGELHYDRIVFDRFAPTSKRGPLLVLPRGGPPSSLDVGDAHGLVDLLVAGADVVVLHAGPPSHSPRSLTLTRAADLTILVVRRGHTRRDSITSLLESLDFARATEVATVLQTSRMRL
jgi:succinoglycan biosynthesis transport protein ExoP